MITRSDRAVAVRGAALCLFAACLCGQAFADGLSAQPAAKPLRVLILSGPGGHDWRATTPFLRQVLTETGRFDVWVCETPAGLRARSLLDFDVLVDVSGGSASRNDPEGEIARFVESGKGLVVAHGALAASTTRHNLDGKNEPAGEDPGKTVQGCWPAFSPGGSHPPVHFLEARIVRLEHAITQGMPIQFRIADALPRGMVIHPGAEVIATAHDEANSDASSNDQPILLALQHGNGRVFCTALGHDLTAMQEPAFIATFARGTEWAATGKVTLPADLSLPRPGAGAVRGLVITGGHEHETSFYTLFDGYKDLAGMPVATSATAFQKDLRGKYDVLIMYDFSRDLDATGKQNLRDFVESGKGVVVLHHALLNYQEWPWWYKEAVGGSYRLRTEGNVPSSTVKDNQQFFVTPQREHPITAGVDPFHIVDEAYKRMWFSPGVRPLLVTDNPSSDRILAWIGPGAAFRVVSIQLGHGPSAFSHPAYRALVHNAILWSAARLR
jgi:type 1 glutamine amidotransferase